MKPDEVIHVFPAVAFVVGEQWLRQNGAFVEDHISSRLFWYDQLEKDLAIISQKMDRQSLIPSYRSGLRDLNNTQKTMFEVHAAALLAAAAISIRLHVSRGDGSG